MAVTVNDCVALGAIPLIAVTRQVTEPPAVALPLIVALLPLT